MSIKNITKIQKEHHIPTGNSEFLKFGYDTGLGSRNSQGYGMFEVIRQTGGTN